MSSEGTGERPAYVPAATLERIVDELTVLDVKLARADYPEGDPMRGFASVYHAAARLGLTDAGEDETAFLSRVRLRDLGPLLEASQSPNARSGTSSSPRSVASGE